MDDLETDSLGNACFFPAVVPLCFLLSLSLSLSLSLFSQQATGREKAPVGRINPNRLFYPGQTYELEELDPYTAPPENAFSRVRRRRAEQEITDDDDLLVRGIHFLNSDLLSRYVTEQGKILPRRKTGLKKKTQRKLVRTIKLARQMAILPTNSREKDFDAFNKGRS